jgi:hypothetical protein
MSGLTPTPTNRLRHAAASMQLGQVAAPYISVLAPFYREAR